VGNQDFLVYLADTATRFLSAEKGENVLRQAAARYPESELLQKAASAEEINREGAGGVNKYRERFAHHAPQEAAAEIEAVLVMPVYANDSELLLYLAELYKKLEKYDKAADIYSRLLALKNSEYIRKMLGYALYRSGDRQQAASYLKSVLMEKPDDPFLSSTLFKIYKEKADIEGLEKLVSEVLAVKPEAKHLYGLLRKAQKWQKNSPT
jgi:predicted Zn-dependent protease